MKFTVQQKKEILAEIVSTKMSITHASEKYGIARKTLYAWMKRRGKLENRYVKGSRNSNL